MQSLSHALEYDDGDEQCSGAGDAFEDSLLAALRVVLGHNTVANAGKGLQLKTAKAVFHAAQLCLQVRRGLHESGCLFAEADA